MAAKADRKQGDRVEQVRARLHEATLALADAAARCAPGAPMRPPTDENWMM